MKIIKVYTPAELADMFTKLHNEKNVSSQEASPVPAALPAPTDVDLYHAPAETYLKFARGGIIND